MNKSLRFNSFVNLTQSLLSGLLVFILYRLITNTLGIASLGIWSVVIATVSTSRLADFGLGSAVTKFVASDLAKGDSKSAAKSVETSLVAVGVIAFFILILVSPIIRYLLSLIFVGDDLVSALNLLPYAIASLWLVLTSTILLSSFDGAQLMLTRAVIVVVGQLIMLVFSLVLIPNFGLLGLALGQLIQGLFLLISSWVLLRKALDGLSVLPSYFSKKIFIKMFKYGFNVQVSGIVSMLFDPLTKALMAKFGGASITGLFEIANQVVLKVRALIISANQAVIPKVAELMEKDQKNIKDLYVKNIKVLLLITMFAFSILLIWIQPLISFLLKDAPDNFYLIYYSLALAWFANTLASPAYFFNLGIGSVKDNTVTHVFMGLLNLIFGLIFGYYYGWHGVLFAYVFSLTIASLYLAINFEIRYMNNSTRLNSIFEKRPIFIIIIALLVHVAAYFLDLSHVGYLKIMVKFIVPSSLLLYSFLVSDLFTYLIGRNKNVC
jgi:O-antigen/teichoic acid export membrane protein